METDRRSESILATDATGVPLDPLNTRVERFGARIGAGDGVHRAFPMRLDDACDIDDRIEAASDGPAIPALQSFIRCVSTWLSPLSCGLLLAI